MLVDEDAAVKDAIARHATLQDLLSAKEETAVTWRNKHLKTIAVIARRPLAKAASLREFRRVNERDLIARFCAEQRQAAPVTWLRSLWDALGRAQALKINLADVVGFAEGLEAQSATERSAQAPRHLHLLGLFPDDHLADETSEGRIIRRLQQHRDLVLTVKRGSAEDWNRIRSFIRSLSGKEKTEANRLLRALKTVPDGASLQDLMLTQVLALWKGKSASTKGTGGGGVRGGCRHAARARRTRRRHAPDAR